MEINPQTKDFFQSKASWGMILVGVNPLLAHFGLQIPMTDEVIQAAMQGAGIVLFLIGQIDRKTTITSVAGVSVAPKAAP